MASWFLWVLAVALFVSVVLLVMVCLHCRTKGPPVSIRQASEDYMPSTQFIIHPSQPSTDMNSLHLPPNLPYLASAGTQRRQPSFTATETESNPSYENPADGPDYINAESDAEDPGYIIVLPEGETPLTNQSRASTPSSDVLHDYENVPEKKVEPSSPCAGLRVSDEDRDYLNVQPLHFHSGSTPELSTCSDTDDDDEANYVNIHSDAQTG